VGDVRRADARVARVDAREVLATHRIRRPIDLARPERKPRDRTDVADADRDLEIAPADERDQRGCVDRPRGDRPRHPAPGAAEASPATVVRWWEAPRRVVDPGPAPRLDPGPVPIAVRRPVGRHARGHPDVAVALDI